MTKPTQATRVMRALVLAGSRGVTQGEWLAPAGADGLGRITRVAARVNELRDEGHTIETDGEREGFAVYKLRAASEPVSGRDRAVVAPTPSVEPTETLFEVPPANDMWRAA